MNIVFVVYGMPSGGAERTISYLSKEFSKTEKVSIFSFSNEFFYEIDPRVNIIKCGITNDKVCLFSRIINMIKRKKRFKSFIRNNKVDIVFLMMPDKISQYILKLRKKYNYLFVTSERANPNFRDESAQKRINNIFFKSDGIIFQTKEVTKYYPNEIINKSIVIPNAVGNDIAYNISYEVEKREKVISAIGRLEEQKDYYTMIDSFYLLNKKYKDYILDIYGAGSMKSKISNYIKTKKLDNKVFIHDPQPDALKRIIKSTAYLLTSKFEGMPNTLLEAMAIGIPSISTNCPFGPSELIKHGENGFLVDVGDVESITKYMIMIIEDIELAKKISANSKCTLITNSMEKISNNYLDYIRYIYENSKLYKKNI